MSDSSEFYGQLKDVNTTDISSAIRLGCRTMQSVFNADDRNIPFFSSSVRPHAELRFSSAHSESHVPGRHLNALLNAEDAEEGAQLILSGEKTAALPCACARLRCHCCRASSSINSEPRSSGSSRLEVGSEVSVLSTTKLFRRELTCSSAAT